MCYARTSTRSCIRPGSRSAERALFWFWLLAFALLYIHGFEAIQHDLVEPYLTVASIMGKPTKQTQAAPASSSKEGTSYADLRDSYVPLFSGQPADYKEWRQRIHLYHRKMAISKRSNESVLNIVGSFTGVTWRLFQEWSIEELEKEDAFTRLITTLDANFAYDSRVQLPSDFENYFNLLQRPAGQTLLLYVTDHEEAYRKLQQHKVELPSQVQGWHLLRRASLSREQRQMITLRAPSLEKNEVIEAMYLILGQDFKGGGWNTERNRRFGFSPQWKNRAYAAAEDYEGEDDDYDHWESGYYEGEDWHEEPTQDPDEAYEFDEDAVYYGDEPWPDDDTSATSPHELAEEYDMAFASYTDARKRFQELKMSRGYLPIVALTDQQGGHSPTSSTTSPSSWRAKGKGKGSSKSGKSKSKTNIRYSNTDNRPVDPRARAKAAMTCLRCGQPGHWAANCPQNASGSMKSGQKRPAPSTTEGMALQTTFKPDESAMLIFQDSNGSERPDCVMLDPGASAFLSGYGPFKRYLDHLKSIDFPVESIRMSKGRRRFQFGGGASLWSDWSAHLPTFIDGKYGTIEVFLLPGGTPMLCGRPIIEALGITMDFAQKRLRFGTSTWTDATLGRQGEYLWSLTAEHDTVYYDVSQPDYELRTADPEVAATDGFHLKDFLEAEHGFTAREELVTKGVETWCVYPQARVENYGCAPSHPPE